MKIHIHRGANQIGGNCIEISTSQARIILDIGDELPEVDSKVHTKELFLMCQIYSLIALSLTGQ